MLPQRQTTAVVDDLDVADVAGDPWAPRWSRPSAMIPAPMPVPTLTTTTLSWPGGDARSPLAEGQDVDVVVDPDRRAVAVGEAVADRVAVPAGHDRRRDRPAGRGTRPAGHADADTPQRPGGRASSPAAPNSSSTRRGATPGPPRSRPARRDGRGSGRRGRSPRHRCSSRRGRRRGRARRRPGTSAGAAAARRCSARVALDDEAAIEQLADALRDDAPARARSARRDRRATGTCPRRISSRTATSASSASSATGPGRSRSGPSAPMARSIRTRPVDFPRTLALDMR